MAVASHYLRIEDEQEQIVLGESEGHGHGREIDISGWSWSVEDKTSKAQRSAAAAARAGAAAGTPAPSRGSGAAATSEETGIHPTLFSFSKAVDMSSIRLMTAMNTGEVFKSAKFTLIQEDLAAVGENAREVFRLEVLLERVKVVSYSLSIRSSEFRVDLEEDWDFNYKNLTFMLHGVGPGYQASPFERPAGSRVGRSPRPPANPQGNEGALVERMERMERALGRPTSDRRGS